MNLVLKKRITYFYLKSLKEIGELYPTVEMGKSVAVYLSPDKEAFMIFEEMLDYLATRYSSVLISEKRDGYIRVLNDFNFPKNFFTIETRYYNSVQCDTISEGLL